MKRLLTVFIMIFAFFTLSSCFVNDVETVKVIVPSGTPTLGIAEALNGKENKIDYQVVSGSDALIGAFVNHNYDIIVAPVNLGAKFYNTLNNYEYVFYQTIVGGCFYLVTSEDINKIQDINGKSITVFGKNSTPDVIIRSLINYYNLNVKIKYVNDVSESNSMLVSGKSSIIISAEPSISKFNANGKFKTLNLQEEWKKIAGSEYAIPQAGIFVKKDRLDNVFVQNVLASMSASLKLAESNPRRLAESAVQIDTALNKIGVETLVKAIPNANFISVKYNREEVEFYFNKLIELDLGATMGGKLPGDDFYA
mgnify:CR=1 FL=1